MAENKIQDYWEIEMKDMWTPVNAISSATIPMNNWGALWVSMFKDERIGDDA